MGTIWHVHSKGNKVRLIDEDKFFSSNHFDYPFLAFYLKNLLETDPTLLPEKIVCYLDNERYTMQYITAVRHLIKEHKHKKRQTFELVFTGGKSNLAETYYRLFKAI